MSETVESATEDELGLVKQAYLIQHHYPTLSTPERFVLVTAAMYDGRTLDELADMLHMSMPTARNHLRWWQTKGAVELSGSGTNSTVRFLGVQHWCEMP